ncbi:T9SS type A sorting domain-containing protein [bacterium]|nr:T9SS type A sorting domain-containing protein [bacterium]
MNMIIWIMLIGLLAIPTRSWALEDLPEDLVSFGVFVSHYDTTTFEQASIAHFPPCTDCDSTLLPLDVDYVAPVDMGHVTYTYQLTGDTIYAATFFWQYPGEILIPDTFLPADSFELEPDMAPNPQYLRTTYEDPELQMSGSYLNEALEFWDRLKYTSIIHAFSESFYTVLLTRFSTTENLMEEHYKWVAIAYRNPLITGIDKENIQQLQNYVLRDCFPNPTNAGTNISYRLPEDLDVALRMFNLLGEQIWSKTIKSQSSGEHSFRWNGFDEMGSEVQSGVYILQLSTTNAVESTKILVIK